MREIKFRVWDSIAEIYSDSELYSITPSGRIFFGNADFTDSPFNTSIEQYTGLKDKNGVEIYEGDVLKNEKGDIIKCVFQVSDSHSVFRFDDGEKPRKMYCNIGKFFEVIGNIHEE